LPKFIGSTTRSKAVAGTSPSKPNHRVKLDGHGDVSRCACDRRSPHQVASRLVGAKARTFFEGRDESRCWRSHPRQTADPRGTRLSEFQSLYLRKRRKCGLNRISKPLISNHWQSSSNRSVSLRATSPSSKRRSRIETKPTKEGFGPRVMGWIGKAVGKFAEGGMKISTSVASNILSEAIKSYYGL
jgi:hypothetical protein